MLFKHRTLTALGLVIALAPTPLFAAETEGDEDTEVVTVISNRLPTTEKNIGSSITVLDNDQIVERQEVTVFDLLRSTPGVSVSRNGGIGTVSTLRIRGATSGQTLVLIDGVKVNDLSAPAGEFNFANLTTDAIERIEILRGPQSTLYGSDAIGGVINIITRRSDDPLNISGFIEGGSFGTFRGGINLGGKTKKTAFNLSLNGTRTDGISAADENAGNTEKDGFRTISVLGRGDHKLTDNLTVNAFFRHADSRADFDAFDFNTGGFTDGDGVTDSEDRQIAVGVVWKWLSGKATTETRISFARTERFDQEFQAPSFASLSKNRTIDLLNTFEVSNEVSVLIGGQLQDNAIETEVFGFFASTLMGSADIKSIFAEIAAKPIENVTLTFGVRHDDHQTFGGHTTFRITGNWQIPKTGTTLRANWGEGFKAPTLFQLFSSFGDPTLQPETSSGWEVGIEQDIIKDRANISLTWFQRKSKNLIDFSLISFTFGNILQTRSKGVEVIFEAKITDKLSVSGNFTHLDAINTMTGLALSRRPKNIFNANVTFDATDRLSISGGINFTARQVDGFAVLAPFKVVDLRARYKVNDQISLYGRIENALDEQYQEVSGFGTPGISAFGGVRGNF